MIYSLGEFKFTTKTNINSLNRSLDSGVSFQERISNHACAVAAKKWSETVSIEGETLPARGAGLKALEPLFDMAKQQGAVSLTSGVGDYTGKFIITSVKEGRQSFTSNGAFLVQTFSIDLRRVEDEKAAE